MSKQTAVEWFVKELFKKIDYIQVDPKLIEQAKAMEKEQSISDYCAGFKASGEGWNGEYGLKDMFNVAEEIEAEKYYQETYGETKN